MFRHIRRYTTSSLPALPPASEWRKLWDTSNMRRPRLSLSNPKTATILVDAFFPPSEDTPTGKVVIEAFSGPGTLTRAMLQLPSNRLRKLIVLEDNPRFFEKIKELEAHDSRVKAFLMSGFDWDSYHQLEQDGVLSDIGIKDWKEDTDLQFVCHIPHSGHGEQLLAQLLRAIPERSWLFKFGRMPMKLLMADSLYQRASAPLKKSKRCKLSVIAEATAQLHQPLPPTNLRPYDDHFWPPSYNPRMPVADSRKPGHPMVAVSFSPLINQIIEPGMLDKWDYCLRRLFVLKSSELSKALPSLAPGANNMIQYIQGPNVAPEDRVKIAQLINALTVKDWANVVKAFDKWPFAPDMLYIQDGVSEKRH